MGGKIEEKYNKKKALNRREWVQVIVQMAVMKYILSGEVDDVSTAVQAFLVSDLAPNADPCECTPPNETREYYCYNEEVDTVLRRHEEALRHLFNRACQLGGVTVAGGLTNKLISFPNYKDFIKAFDLIDADLTERDATLCFVWARMLTIDEQHEKSRIKWTHLSFEDF